MKDDTYCKNATDAHAGLTKQGPASGVNKNT